MTDVTPGIVPIDPGSTAWMLMSSALVLLMVPGLALFYGGLVRRKNVLTTMMHSFAGHLVLMEQTMKLITAIVRPERLEAVQHELQGVLDEDDHYRLSVETIEGHGRQEGEIEIYRSQRFRSSLVEKLKLTLGVNEA